MSKEKEILKEVGESPQYRLFEFFLQEHGITLLEGQMHDIIHEVQLYLDATNDNPVVKENLTSEENLITAISPQLKTPEEKAREEAETMISEYANNSHISREYYAEGYLSGYHSRDEEVKELREALKFCEIALKNIADPISYLISEADKSGSKVDGRGLIEFANNSFCISNMAKDALVKLEKLKAKQLLQNDNK